MAEKGLHHLIYWDRLFCLWFSRSANWWMFWAIPQGKQSKYFTDVSNEICQFFELKFNIFLQKHLK